ncbi:branched-chain amino acid aminotransferase [Tolumonas auensis DSM 9187]|uniref:Branched-chain-amino-acid aminotransferase n=1 Tax=Tolumonas auensis (strain DSM 9187 / NBRC 110442 / TA 4) TaxID=595494 RepID=C4LDS0_TOLAT|nr:branched-chain amino acid transaminase [Tolumonas auensis]ACQ94681.1 branched-chain amino acid aminotransferase [Tolumonas auensis DSM 9187]
MSQTTKYIWFNGEMVEWDRAQVHVMTHALHYGSSVFEGIRAYDTPNGTAVFRLKEHIQRLFDSAKIYWMEMPFDKAAIEQACCDIVTKNGMKSAYLRPLAFIGNVGLGVLPKSDKVEVMIGALPWGAYLGDDALANGVDVMVSSWSRLAPNTIPTGAKAGGNYLSSQLIAREARRNGYVEGIALDTNGYISEGSGENLFIIKNGVLYTSPATSGILPGITRDTIMTLARELGYTIREESLQREALYLADEIFMCGTAAEITPVSSVDRMQIGEGRRGPITEAIQKSFFGLFNGETEDKWGWLTPVSK